MDIDYNDRKEIHTDSFEAIFNTQKAASHFEDKKYYAEILEQIAHKFLPHVFGPKYKFPAH